MICLDVLMSWWSVLMSWWSVLMILVVHVVHMLYTCCTHVVHMLYMCCTRDVQYHKKTGPKSLSFFFDIGIQGRVGANVVVFFPFSDRPPLPKQATHRRKSCTCWWYSLCHFQYRQQYEKTCLYNFECWIYTNMYFYIFILCVNTMTSMINTNAFPRFYWFSGTTKQWRVWEKARWSKRPEKIEWTTLAGSKEPRKFIFNVLVVVVGGWLSYQKWSSKKRTIDNDCG